MTAQEARIIAEQVNQPKIEQWLKDYPISNIIKQIKSASAAGFYGIEYALPHNTPTFVSMYLINEFTGLGYDVTSDALEDDNNNTVLFKLTIRWGNY